MFGLFSLGTGCASRRGSFLLFHAARSLQRALHHSGSPVLLHVRGHRFGDLLQEKPIRRDGRPAGRAEYLYGLARQPLFKSSLRERGYQISCGSLALHRTEALFVEFRPWRVQGMPLISIWKSTKRSTHRGGTDPCGRQNP